MFDLNINFSPVLVSPGVSVLVVITAYGNDLTNLQGIVNAGVSFSSVLPQ